MSRNDLVAYRGLEDLKDLPLQWNQDPDGRTGTGKTQVFMRWRKKRDWRGNTGIQAGTLEAPSVILVGGLVSLRAWAGGMKKHL